MARDWQMDCPKVLVASNYLAMRYYPNPKANQDFVEQVYFLSR